ncbi:MAG: hypothetical protein HOQ43_10935 [Glycomyces artemisiae]|uniref:Tail protein n=1 Tax=Glycomyces artemisiae TaxID=1076443 RepID=A0A850C3T8_9ACTN|nr:hypothetical protein [Glycomyces artemisiae]
MLDERQISLRGLVMGPGTPYKILEFEAWTRTVRASDTDRAWAHGAYSGAEWHKDAVIPILVEIQASSATEWRYHHRRLAAAARPVETGSSPELRYRLRGDTEEFMQRVRPRGVMPKIRQLGGGMIRTGLSVVALDPTVYSGEEYSTGDVGLPLIEGGLVAPWTAPLLSVVTISAGRATLLNRGDRAVGLRIRLTAGADGLVQPVITMARPDGIVQSLRIALDLTDGDYLDIDTSAQTIVLNGTASRRSYVTGDWPILPGTDPLAESLGEAILTSDLSWSASAPSETATMSALWRDAYST